MFLGARLNEPAEQYHSIQGYVPSSPIPEMKKSPAHFVEKWQNGVESTPAMDKGEFIHKLLLEQDIEKYVARPLKEDGSLVRSNSKEYAAWLAENPGKTPIAPDLYNDALPILTAACNHEKFVRAFEKSDAEASFYAKHSNGLYLKARPDMIAKDRSFILDVKSTSDISTFEKQIFNLGYDVRLIHYAETIKALEGVEIPEIYFFAIESKAPYGCKIIKRGSRGCVHSVGTLDE